MHEETRTCPPTTRTSQFRDQWQGSAESVVASPSCDRVAEKWRDGRSGSVAFYRHVGFAAARDALIAEGWEVAGSYAPVSPVIDGGWWLRRSEP